jgi:hypothetical protein
MNSWFSVRVKYTRQMEDGTFKRVSEDYLVDAVNFSEAEERIYREVGEEIRGEFIVNAIKRESIHDIIADLESDELFYTCVVSVDSMDADSGRSKSVRQTVVVGAKSVEHATAILNTDFVSHFVVPVEIKSVKESRIVGILPYVAVENESN